MYLQGFGNTHQTEAVSGALPLNQNSPQQCAFGLYAEQFSGSAFTRARHQNLHSWLYRLLPTVAQGCYQPYEQQLCQAYAQTLAPNPLRWFPLQNSLQEKTDFIEGLFHVAGTTSLQAYLYDCNASMTNRYFSSLDGELLFVPHLGEISLHTEFGQLHIKPGMIAVIPQGIKFSVELINGPARGYLCENAGSPLTLPELGPIGANGLANPRHFNYPIAAFEDDKSKATIICKHQNKLWACQTNHSPLNVVAWYGNYAPYSYDLSLFNTINTVSFDHPDPSLFTVLTSASDTPGVSNLDFVIFPARWMVADHTFRLPYFHRNCMSELMGLITGTYDAKEEDFLPGGFSIHNAFIPHGPDVASFEICSTEVLKPQLYTDTLAFMFETRDLWQVTEQALAHPSFQKDYVNCWQGFRAGSVG